MSFFNLKTGKRPNTLTLETMHSLECMVCPLKEAGKARGVLPIGGVGADLYVLGESPTMLDPDGGNFFISRAGQLLRRSLPDLSKVRVNSVVRTVTPNARAPIYAEIECCRPSVVADIQKTKPKALITLGYAALRWVMGEATPRLLDMQGRRFMADIGGVRLWVYPTVHPEQVLKKGGAKTLMGVCFINDVKRAAAQATKIKPPHIYSESDLLEKILPQEGDFASVMRSLEVFIKSVLDSGEKVVGVDIETTSKEELKSRRLRPYGKGSELVCIGLSGANKTISVPVFHSENNFSLSERNQIKERLVRMIKKDFAGVVLVAHNLLFELEWLAVLLDNSLLECRNFGCSMAQAYVLDCRSGLSLEAVAMMRLGVNVKQISNVSVDNIVTEPLSEVLVYCGLDAKVCRMLYLEQEKELRRKNMMAVYAEQVNRAWAVALVQVNGGLKVDTNTAEQKDKQFSGSMKLLTKEIRKIKEVKEFEKKTGIKFNPDSSDHCFEALEAVLPKSGSTSTAKPVLEKVKHPLAESILKFRSMSKMRGTYIESLKPGGKYLWEGNLIRPTFHTMRTVTRRLSSSDPNAQNYPKREFGHLRDMIVSPKKHLLVSVDYSQMEVRVLAMASQDKTLIKFVKDGYDFHSEWAEKIHKISKGAWTGGKKDKKTQRQLAKTYLVFPLFYGAYPASIARSLGMRQAQVETLSTQFWSMFAGVRLWQKSVRRFYEKNGYVELLTGFRSYGVLTENQLFNFPVQGSASDLVVDAMVRLCELAMKTGKTRFIPLINIHDDLTFYLPKKKLKKDLKKICKVMRKSEYRFTKGIPIDVEISVGKLWGSMKDYE